MAIFKFIDNILNRIYYGKDWRIICDLAGELPDPLEEFNILFRITSIGKGIYQRDVLDSISYGNITCGVKILAGITTKYNKAVFLRQIESACETSAFKDRWLAFQTLYKIVAAAIITTNEHEEDMRKIFAPHHVFPPLEPMIEWKRYKNEQR